MKALIIIQIVVALMFGVYFLCDLVDFTIRYSETKTCESATMWFPSSALRAPAHHLILHLTAKHRYVVAYAGDNSAWNEHEYKLGNRTYWTHINKVDEVQKPWAKEEMGK